MAVSDIKEPDEQGRRTSAVLAKREFRKEPDEQGRRFSAVPAQQEFRTVTVNTATYADRLASRVKKVLKKQVRDKGYEVDAVLSKKVGGDALGINDDGSGSKTVFSVPVKIIVTSHDIELFPMELGDNPDDILDFIWLPPDDFLKEPDEQEIPEDTGDAQAAFPPEAEIMRRAVPVPAQREFRPGGEDKREVDEGLCIQYLENDYTVTVASPTCLGGNLVIKECRAKKVR